jgi:glucose/mannose-6-phosphate isomerase
LTGQLDPKQLDPKQLERNDPSGMLRAVLSLAEQSRAGYEIGKETSPLPDALGITSIAVCGMGGSGVAGDVLHALYRERLRVPLAVVKEPLLPGFCNRDTLVVCSSYSGDTSETLACYEEAAERGCRVIAVTSGGELGRRARDRGAAVVSLPGDAPAPRAAFGYLVFGSLGALEAMGVLASAAEDVVETVRVLAELSGEIAPGNPENPARRIADELQGKVPLIWGAEGISAVAATRWKTDLNENAKVPAFDSSLPELDHNEIVGWSENAGEPFALIVLRHEGEHPAVAARFPLSVEIAESSGLVTREVWGRGHSAMARLLSLVMMGSATSVYLAFLQGVDPTPIEAIDRLKRTLAEERRP